jgi:hypothetical protein
MTAALWGLATVAFLRSRSSDLLLPAALAGAPYAVLALQSYGGEGLLRAHLASLPFLVVLSAQAWRMPGPPPEAGGAAAWHPPTRVTRVLTGGVTALVGLSLAFGFLLARYGNESFEQMRASDVRSVQAFYAIAAPGSTLFLLQESVPFRYQDVEKYAVATLDPPPWETEDAQQALAAMEEVDGPAYLLVTEGQWEQARLVSGVRPHEVDRLRRMLAASPSLQIVWSDDESFLYRAASSRDSDE